MGKPEIPRRWLASGKFQIVLFLFACLYVISPIDLIPDVMPVVGWLDDAAVFMAEVIAFLTYLKYRREESEKKYS